MTDDAHREPPSDPTGRSDPSNRPNPPGRSGSLDGPGRSGSLDGPGPPAWLVSAFRRLAHWTSPHAALLITLAMGLMPALLLTLGSAEVYEAVVESDGVAQLDQPILDAALAVRSPGLDTVVTGFTHLAGEVGMPILAGAAMLVMALRWRSWTPVWLLTAAAAGSLLMTVAGKDLIGRIRPPLADAVPPYEYSASFPSGHSLNSVVIAGVVAYLVILHQRSLAARVCTAAAAALFALAVGLSRVYLGHHWFTDVLVAWTLGLAWLAVVITAHQLLRSRRTAARNARESRASRNAGDAGDAGS